MSLVVDLVYILLLVTIAPIWLVRRLIAGKRTAPLRPRLGFLPPLPAAAGPTIWLHAVSVGETLALRALIARLRESRPDARLVLTVTTVAGLDVARKNYPDVVVLESPLDFSFAVRRFLRALRPSVLVLTELELWPNLLRLARGAGVPVVVVNARVSDKSARRYALLMRAWPGFLDPIVLFCAQNEDHAKRLRGLGVDEKRIAVVGNLKFDNAPVQDPTPIRRALRTELGWSEGDPTLAAGSTHPGEHEQVVEAFLRVRKRFPAARLVLAPRHRERFDDVAAHLRARGVDFSRRSSPGSAAGSTCCLLDTIGELGRFFAVGDVAFVGGTLVPIGGHNLLEPGGFGIPMVVGPHHATVRDAAVLFAQSGALVEVRDVEALASCVAEFFSAPSVARERGARAQRIIESCRGAAVRCADAILARLVSGTANKER